MKKIYKIFFITTIICAVSLFTGSCERMLTTSSSVDISDANVLPNAANLEMVLISTYNNLLLNNSGQGRDYAGITGLQFYVDLGGADILCHTQFGGTQFRTYQYDNNKTEYTGAALYIWQEMYKNINQTNIIIDNIDESAGPEKQKLSVKGQALAIRALSYFHLIQNYQQTYVIAKDKPGVLLRLSQEDPIDLPRASVEDVYQQIVKDLLEAKTLLTDFQRPEPWMIDEYVASGILARVYLVMNEWDKAYKEAEFVYEKYNTLMTKEQWQSGFDMVITDRIQEVAWAVGLTDEDNVGDFSQYNFWYNFDASYGEGYNDGPIYCVLNFFADGKYEKLFEKGEDRYMFWKRTNNSNKEWSSKWAYNKYKHYGADGGAVGGRTRPEIPLMRGSEMLLIMAEAAAQSATYGPAKSVELLNRLQLARNVVNITTTTNKSDLLEAIYVERRKELLCEGVTGHYDLLRLQKPLVRYCETDTYIEGHYTWGCIFLDGYSPSDAKPMGTIPSNDYRFICQIPEYEFANNAALTEADQNPFSGQ